MSDWVHYTEDGYVEYVPCVSCEMGIIEEILEPTCKDCPERFNCDQDCDTARWLGDELEKCDAREYRIKCPEPPDDMYNGGEICEMLEDAGIFPYRDMVMDLDAAVTAVLAKHPDAKLQRPKKYWLEGDKQ